MNNSFKRLYRLFKLLLIDMVEPVWTLIFILIIVGPVGISYDGWLHNWAVFSIGAYILSIGGMISFLLLCGAVDAYKASTKQIARDWRKAKKYFKQTWDKTEEP